MNEIRDADLNRDLETIRNLWLDYLAWGNDELEARHGFRLPVHEMVERDLANIAKFQPPSGRIFLAFAQDAAVGIAARAAGYGSIRLDSPDFMTAAHALYRSSGFADIESYPESEIPDEHKWFCVFMEMILR
jgi:hypothetical protein